MPGLLLLANVILIPFILGIVNSFTDWDGFTLIGENFVGLANYTKIFSNGNFTDAFLRTLKFAAIVILLLNVIGFALACLVTQKFRTRSLLRTVYFLPNVMGGLVLGFVWHFVFNKVFVQMGRALRAEGVLFNWLTDGNMAFWAIVLVSVWQMMGYIMVIYIAGIQNIPREVMEASRIDGASKWQSIRKIVFPLVMPAFTVSLFLSLNYAFKQFDVALALTGGGPYGSTTMVTMDIYSTAYKFTNYASAQAEAVIFFIVIVAIAIIQLSITKKREVEL
jgi:raffinose/stachyose/melibiose transport system permease protein